MGEKREQKVLATDGQDMFGCVFEGGRGDVRCGELYESQLAVLEPRESAAYEYEYE